MAARKLGVTADVDSMLASSLGGKLQRSSQVVA
jgi:hypothetical protein